MFIVSRKMSHKAAVWQALFVTFLWSTSWVLIKLGLPEIPALTFAGLRYMLAFLVLLPFALGSAGNRAALGRLSGRDWALLALYGLLFVAVTQGAQFIGLGLLPAATMSLMLNLSPLMVVLFGAILLREKSTRAQLAGVGVYALGILTYFLPTGFASSEVIGIVVALIAVVANAGSSVLGRFINRVGAHSALLVTTISMGIGATALLAAGLVTQGLPALSSNAWLYVGWLAVVNTALAFPLWNSSLRILMAVESSLINSTMMAQIALLAFVFLGESLSAHELVGMALVAVGVVWVQVGGNSKPRA